MMVRLITMIRSPLAWMRRGDRQEWRSEERASYQQQQSRVARSCKSMEARKGESRSADGVLMHVRESDSCFSLGFHAFWWLIRDASPRPPGLGRIRRPVPAQTF